MAARMQWHRFFGVVLGSVLVAGIAGTMACEIDEPGSGVQADSQIVVEAGSSGLRDREGGYVFVDVGAWDDTNLTWPAADAGITKGRSDSDGYKFLDVGTWDDTTSELPVFLPMPEADPAGTHGYRFFDVDAWDDTNVDWPAGSGSGR